MHIAPASLTSRCAVRGRTGSGGGAGPAEERIGDGERPVGDRHDAPSGSRCGVVDEVAHDGQRDVGDRVGAHREPEPGLEDPGVTDQERETPARAQERVEAFADRTLAIADPILRRTRAAA